MARTHGNRQKHESTNPLQARLIERFHAHVVDLVRQVGPASVLEVGCGEGYVLAALQEVGIEARLSGIDLAPEAVAAARERLGSEVDLRVADAATLQPGGHDLVLMIEVLEHLDDPAAVLGVLDDLAPRAVLLSVPWEPWFRVANVARLKNVRQLGNDPEHVNHWSKRGFRDFVASRFTVRTTVQSFPWTLVLAER